MRVVLPLSSSVAVRGSPSRRHVIISCVDFLEVFQRRSEAMTNPVIRLEAEMFDAKAIVAVLSTSISVAENAVSSIHGCWCAISQKSSQIQDASHAHADISRYSASPEDRAMKVFFVIFQFIGEPLSRTTYPVVDLRVFQ
eukprot:IDg17288t1